MLPLGALFLVVFIISTSAAPTPDFGSLVIHEQINSPAGFVSDGAASGDTSLTLHVALKSNDLKGLEAKLYEVSTPGNPLYGQHLKKKEAESFVAPSSDTKNAVEGWLNSQGIQPNDVSLGVNYLSFNVTVSKANKMLDADFTVWRHENTGKQSIRTLQYSVPSSLKDHINLILPGVIFPPAQRASTTIVRTINRSALPNSALVSAPTLSFSRPFAPSLVIPNPSAIPSAVPSAVPSAAPSAAPSFIPSSVCNETNGIAPKCIQALYGLPSTVGSQNESRIAVAGFIDQFAQNADLSLFLKKFRPDLDPQLSFSLQTLDGGRDIQNSSDAGVEANLDIQYTVGVAGGVPVTFVSEGPNFSSGDITGDIDFVHFLLSQENPAQTVSVSYGNNEDLPVPFVQQVCNEYMQLAARGVSVLIASGDGGVSGGQTQDCTTFIPTFPSGCPFVTSVGGTQGINPETAAALSSGGFSNIFAMPAYQTKAVNAYLEQLGSTNAGLFNASGRAFPDIAAHAISLFIFNAGIGELVDGTSCAAPIVASTIGQINALRIQEGKSPLGFLNPLIYSTEGLFDDITSGSNPGCNTNGFPAMTGWDPVTGLGTPNFNNLKALP